MGVRRGIAAACFVLACGTPKRPGTPAQPPSPAVKTYGPLGIKDDAKAPNQAVILGTDDKDGSTVIPLPTDAVRAQVDAMFIKLAADPKQIAGGISPVKLTTGPNPDHSVQVGVFEEMAGGAGPQWRAGVWISAIVAATTLNKDLTDFTFSAASNGYIDGASASGLMAAGFLAALTGAPVDMTVTMTGSINPDGTMGPVAGIPEKFLAAIEKGKKRIGYPVGLRYAKSAKTGAVVDLEALAKKHGITAIEVADIYEAYELLTNKRLPAPVPVSEKEMALDAATISALDTKYKAWQQRLATEWGAILLLESAGRLPPLLSYLRDQAKQAGKAAEALKKRGVHAAAYARMFEAALYANVTNEVYNVLAKVQANKINDAVAMLAKYETLAASSQATFTKIGGMRPPTMGGHMQMLAAFNAALRGWVFESVASKWVLAAKTQLESLAGKSTAELGSDEVASQVINVMVPALMYVGKTTGETTLATEQLDVQAASDINYTCSLENVKRMATSFQSAGAAGMNYFDALLVHPYAEQAKISTDEARMRVATFEQDYLVAFVNSQLASADGLPKQLKDQWGEDSLPWGLMSLAGSQLAYTHAAELIAKYYSLQVEVANDGSGRITKVEHEKAFATMLANAERTARASARAARIATGSIPVQAKLAYQNANVDRNGSISDRMDALAQYWSSSAYSQTAVMLARN